MKEMRTFERIQTEYIAWHQYNFPDSPSWVPLIGMVEEVGEMMAANLQGDQPETIDAIGDICIYMTDYCNAMGYDMTLIWDSRDITDPVMYGQGLLRSIQIQLGKVAHAHIKEFQKIRMHEDHPTEGKRALGQILLYLDRLAREYHRDVLEIAANVWDKVKARDWQKNRDKAHQIQAEILCQGILPTSQEGQMRKADQTDIGQKTDDVERGDRD